MCTYTHTRVCKWARTRNLKKPVCPASRAAQGLTEAVHWPLHLRDTAHRWDHARAITDRLRTVRVAASARVCLRAERVQALLWSRLKGRNHKLTNLVCPRREGGINAIRHLCVRSPSWPPTLIRLLDTNDPTRTDQRPTRPGWLGVRRLEGVVVKYGSTLRGARDEGARVLSAR